MNQITFTVRGNPIAQKRHRTVRKGNFTRRYDPSESDKADFLGIVQNKAPEIPLSVGLKVYMTFYMAIPKGTPKYKKRLMESEKVPHLKKPDLSNLQKMIEDALEGVFYINDSQIYFTQPRKFYSPTPRTEVAICWENDGSTLFP